jgi:hypothetical protein
LSLLAAAHVLAGSSMVTAELLSVTETQQAGTAKMVDSLTVVADEVCLEKPAGMYPHPSNPACVIVCYGSDQLSPLTGTLGHQRCCSADLCYSPRSGSAPAGCEPCASPTVGCVNLLCHVIPSAALHTLNAVGPPP